MKDSKRDMNIRTNDFKGPEISRKEQFDFPNNYGRKYLELFELSQFVCG